MDIDRFKQQHVQILQGIHRMRQHAREGVAQRAHEISHEIRTMKSKIALHLSIEDNILYPRLQKLGDDQVARMARAYQEEMKVLSSGFADFVERWKNGAAIAADPEGFRRDCNVVIKALHQRIQQENTQFYPVVERLG